MTRIYFDGAHNSCNGMLTGCLVIVRNSDAQVVRWSSGYSGSNDAEWLALIGAAQFAAGNDLHNVEMVGDALSVIEVALGLRPGTRPRTKIFRTLLDTAAASITNLGLRHVERRNNLAGIYLDGGHSPAFHYALKRLDNASTVSLIHDWKVPCHTTPP
jgi:hypothetical protein